MIDLGSSLFNLRLFCDSNGLTGSCSGIMPGNHSSSSTCNSETFLIYCMFMSLNISAPPLCSIDLKRFPGWITSTPKASCSKMSSSHIHAFPFRKSFLTTPQKTRASSPCQSLFRYSIILGYYLVVLLFAKYLSCPLKDKNHSFLLTAVIIALEIQQVCNKYLLDNELMNDKPARC